MSAGVLAARAELAANPRPHGDKRASAAEAVSLIRDGDHVAVGGTLYSRTPMALLFALLKAGRHDLSLSRPLTCYEAELFMVTGAVNRIVTSWMGIGLRWGLSPVLRRYVESGEVVYEEWSHLALGLRYAAAGMGVPFLPTATMLGSDLVAATGARRVSCPYTGAELLAVPALVPDVALIHVHRADAYGNAQVDGYRHMDLDMARAARRVVVSAEAIVEPERIAARPDTTMLPHFLVDAVVEAPFGAYPHEMYGRYDADLAHFDNYVDRLRREGPVAGVLRYLDQTLLVGDGFGAFLDSVGPARMAELTRAATGLVP